MAGLYFKNHLKPTIAEKVNEGQQRPELLKQLISSMVINKWECNEKFDCGH